MKKNNFKKISVKSTTISEEMELRIFNDGKMIGYWDRERRELTLYLPYAELKQYNFVALMVNLFEWVELTPYEFETTKILDASGNKIATVRYEFDCHHFIDGDEISGPSFWCELRQCCDNSVDFEIYQNRLELGSVETIDGKEFIIVHNYVLAQEE